MTDLRAHLETALGNVFDIERELGGGGMSRVFVATERALGRKVVIKVLPSEAAGAVSLERFKREIELAARLQQANIVPVLSAGAFESIPYFTMPYVAGESLRARLAVGGQLPIGETVGLLREIARALAYAHEQGIVHRDIKPDNVLVSGGTAMVTDFGVAKALNAATTGGGDALTGTGMTLGTPAYMAPEQATGDPRIDHRVDIYAFGCLAYELLTGAPPFAGRSMQAAIAAHIAEAPVPVERQRAGVPQSLASLVARCLAKNPADRPQSARELLTALDQVSSSPQLVALARRAPMARLGILVVVMLVVVAAGLWVARRGSRTAGPIVRSVAVLPMQNIGGDSTQEYFAVGIAEDIAGALVGSGVRIMPMSSAMSPVLSQAGLSMDSICKLLGVDAIITGTARRLSNRLRVTVSLARRDSVIWFHAYDQTAPDLLALQRTITDSVVGAVRTAIGAAPPQTRHHVEDLVSHDLAMQGWFYLRLGTQDGLERAKALFAQALQRDSLNARALSGVSYAWAETADGFVAPAAVFDSTIAPSLRILALDSASAEGWATVALMNAQWKWNWPVVAEQLARARSLDPQHPYESWTDGIVAIVHGHADEALTHWLETARLAPLDPLVSTTLEWAYLSLGQYDSVIAQSRRTQRLTPNFAYIESFSGYAFGMLGRDAEADSAFRMAEAVIGHRSAGLAWLRARQGRRAEALSIANDLERSWSQHYFSPELLAIVYTALGDKDRAFEWLRRGLTSRSAVALLDPTVPMLAPLRSDPRFREVLRTLNVVGSAAPNG